MPAKRKTRPVTKAKERITVYIPGDLYRKLEKYKSDLSCDRSRAITEVLRQFFNK